MDERPPFKRKADTSDASARKSAKMSTSGSGGKMSFAARMMAKMGHVEGQGLGKAGEGILNPIEVKLRPQGAGVGAVKEKTEQAKAEARRAAEQRGEQYEDSSEEERKARRRRKEMSKSGVTSGASTPGGFTRPKAKYRTAAEIEASADGLAVPNVLKSLIDATGRETKLLTSAAGLMTVMPGTSATESEAEKIAKRARRDLETFVDSWNEVMERKKWIAADEEQLRRELEEQETALVQAQEIAETLHGLQKLDLRRPRTAQEAQSDWGTVVQTLEGLQSEHGESLAGLDMQATVVAAIHPLFKQEMLDWSPLESHNHLVSYFHRLGPMLGIDRLTNKPADSRSLPEQAFRKSSTPYESLIYNLWLPRVRATITNEWDPHDPLPLLNLIEAWRDILPPFILYSVVNNQIATKLTATIQAWNPRTSLKRSSSSKSREPLPHIWLFPWLPHLASHHTDSSSSHGLLADVKRKLRVVLDTWPLDLGVLPGLSAWRDALGPDLENLLLRHLLPRLARHLHDDFTVYPPDQNLDALEHVLAWSEHFRPRVTAQLLVKEFFPKWLGALHAWLTGDGCDYEEVGAWFAWWKGQIPEQIRSVPEAEAQWRRGLEMLNAALDLVDEGRSVEELPAPVLDRRTELPTAPIAPLSFSSSAGAALNGNGAAEQRRRDAERQGGGGGGGEEGDATFRDVLEEWCVENDLTLKPLREAHATTGLPVFRVSASADGTSGGAKVYLRGDVVMVQSRKDRAVWEPMGLGEGLIARAEMR